jgi:hypothetical protein
MFRRHDEARLPVVSERLAPATIGKDGYNPANLSRWQQRLAEATAMGKAIVICSAVRHTTLQDEVNDLLRFLR